MSSTDHPADCPGCQSAESARINQARAIAWALAELRDLSEQVI